MKITWLAVNASFSHTSVALPLLHVAARHVPADWKVVRATPKDNLSAVVARVVETQPDAVAATVYLFTHRFVAEVLARVKAVCPGVCVIVGGPEFLGANEPFLRAAPSWTSDPFHEST